MLGLNTDPPGTTISTSRGQSEYCGGFIEHHLIPMLYPSSLTPPIQIAIGLFVIAISLTIYLWPMVLSFKATSEIAINRCECVTAFLHSAFFK